MLQFQTDKLIQAALAEDIHYYDVSSEPIFAPEQRSNAYFVAKAEGVLAGLPVALRVFELLDERFSAQVFYQDGARVKPGDILAEFSGGTIALLQGERTALNLLQHLSGVATMTARAVALTAGSKACITDTRKTLPGLRALQKAAVLCGGGKNHRFNLSDAAMLKDNHIDAAGGIAPAVTKLRGAIGHMVKIEVETRNLEEVQTALEAGADCIMLDNMTPQEMRQAVDLVAGRTPLEASGNITLENLRDVAQTGVDIISMGALTHSVQAFDISMKFRVY